MELHPIATCCTASICDSLGSILDTPISSTLKIHGIFVQSPKNAF